MEKKKSTGSKIKIDSKIPMPKRTSSGRRLKYPWPDMKVGDSFFAEVPNNGSLHSGAKSYGLRNGLTWKFATCAEGTGTRIWRIE